MKNTLYTLVLSTLTLAACQTNEPSYTISGTITDGAKGVTMVYLTERIGDETIKLDSAVVTDGKFTFIGRQDSAKYCWLDLHTPERMHSCGDLFLENGKITAILGTPNEYPVTGTPNNDIYQAYKDVVLEVHKTLDSPSFLKNTKENQDKILKELQQKRVKAFESILENHMNTAVGIHFFVDYKLSMEQQKAALAKIPETYLNNPRVQQAIKKMELREKTLVGKPYIDFEMPTPDGNTLKLSDIVSKNKYTLINFWRSKSTNWTKPIIMDVYNKYHQKGIGFVSISLDTDEAQWKASVKEQQLPWSQISDLKGEQCEAKVLYCIEDYSRSVIIAQDGTIVARDIHYSKLNEKLAEILQE